MDRIGVSTIAPVQKISNPTDNRGRIGSFAAKDLLAIARREVCLLLPG